MQLPHLLLICQVRQPVGEQQGPQPTGCQSLVALSLVRQSLLQVAEVLLLDGLSDLWPAPTICITPHALVLPGLSVPAMAASC